MARKELNKTAIEVSKNQIVIIFENGNMYPAVVANKNGVINCPFCKKKHTHGVKGGNGHRVTHCNSGEWHDIQTEEGIDIKKEDGYYLIFEK